jgi:beta-glucosidase
MVGDEMERFGIHLWLAPALNIHRNVLCGRNFEYYSEDPLISGKIASAITKGVQKHSGCGVTIKHFVANNQETNRFHSNSIMSERTLRDIYLKGFEIAVKEAKPHALMTSYNLLNGEHTSQRRDLNITVLREEWGYEGLIMSDWVTPGLVPGVKFKYPYACASGSIKAGNDIMMPGTRLDHQNLMEALEDPEHEYHITRAHLEMCAENVIKVARKLGGAKDAGKRPI